MEVVGGRSFKRQTLSARQTGGDEKTQEAVCFDNVV